MKKNKLQFRQGDLLIEHIEGAPKGERVKPEAGKLILAYGEATGHMHYVDAARDVQLFKVDDGELFLQSIREVALRHNKHGEIKLPAGVNRVTRQREHTPWGERRVED